MYILFTGCALSIKVSYPRNYPQIWLHTYIILCLINFQWDISGHGKLYNVSIDCIQQGKIDHILYPCMENQ